VIFNHIYDFLKDGLHFTEEDYKYCSTDLTEINESKQMTLQIKLHSAQGALKAVVRDVDTISLNIVRYTEDSPIYKSNYKRITDLEAQREELENKISRLKKEIASLEGNNLSVSQFLNLSKLAGSKLEAADPIAKDRICRMLFLNLTVDEEKVVDLQIREPYATLLKTKKYLNGRTDRIHLKLFEWTRINSEEAKKLLATLDKKSKNKAIIDGKRIIF
jgi:ACT domain-containing protein